MQRQSADSRLLAFHRRHGLGGYQRHAAQPVAQSAPPQPHVSRSPSAAVYCGPVALDSPKPSVWDSELWAWPLAAVSILVLWLALVVGGNAPVSAYHSASDRPSADAAVDAPTLEVPR